MYTICTVNVPSISAAPVTRDPDCGQRPAGRAGQERGFHT